MCHDTIYIGMVVGARRHGCHTCRNAVVDGVTFRYPVAVTVGVRMRAGVSGVPGLWVSYMPGRGLSST